MNRFTVLLNISIVLAAILANCSPSRKTTEKRNPDVGLPSYPPISGAHSDYRKSIEIVVPTSMNIIGPAENRTAVFDSISTDVIKTDVGYNMVVGLYVNSYKVSDSGRHLLSRALESGGGPWKNSLYWHNFQLSTDDSYIELELIVFETDIPAQHMWMPRSDKYRVLWTRTFTTPHN